MSFADTVRANNKGIMILGATLFTLGLIFLGLWLYYRNKLNKCTSNTANPCSSTDSGDAASYDKKRKGFMIAAVTSLVFGTLIGGTAFAYKPKA